MDGKIVGIVAIVCVFGMPVILGMFHMLSSTWLRAVNHARDTELKHRLVEAGMTADEIERIVRAGSPADSEAEDEEEAWQARADTV